MSPEGRSAQDGRDDNNQLDRAGQTILSLLDKAADAADENSRHALEMAQKFTTIFKKLGFQYVALDLEGYRQGSLNEVLQIKSA